MFLACHGTYKSTYASTAVILSLATCSVIIQVNIIVMLVLTLALFLALYTGKESMIISVLPTIYNESLFSTYRTGDKHQIM